jgi:hypothetical protein
MNRVFGAACALIVLSLAGCAPEPGSPEWCEKMKNTPQAQWTVNDGQIYLNKCNPLGLH